MNEGARKPRPHNPITAMFDRLNEDGPALATRADATPGSNSDFTSVDPPKILKRQSRDGGQTSGIER